jgi:hypothetical protein
MPDTFPYFFKSLAGMSGGISKTNCAICDRNIEARGWKAKGISIARAAEPQPLAISRNVHRVVGELQF